MAYSRQNMMYDYDWTIHENRDTTIFNRESGPEVLKVINAFLKKVNLTSVGSGNKAEKLLKEKLSSRNYSSKEVLAFLSKHWSDKSTSGIRTK